MAIELRRLRANEWPALRELRLRSLLDAPEAFGQTHGHGLTVPDEEWQQMARASSAGNARIWLIASRDGEDVGLVQARRRPPEDCLIFSMWVAPQARRAGVGQLLIDAVARWAQGWGGRRLILWVFGANEGANRFYARIGFTVVADGPDADSGKSFGAFAVERAI